jgi:cellulose synthase (UDP-forming)
MLVEATEHSRNNTSAAVSNERVFTWWDYPLFSLLTCLSLGSISYFLSYWFSAKDWHQHPILLLIMTFMLFLSLLNSQVKWFLLLFMKRPRPMPAGSDWKVGVVTTFVPEAEPLEMLEETVRALIALDYPHDTWVLDEGDEERVKTLCLRLGAKHFSRKNLSQYQTDSGLFQSRSKHGNYNAWLYEIGFKRYEIITAFDPDHVPHPCFLSQVLGYFDDSSVAYVQVAQAYYNQSASFIARGAAEETYTYYSTIQMASYGMGYPVVIGCHNTHRVTALQEVGGFAPHNADDLLITLFYRARGWQGVYIPRILARGLTPVDWHGYVTQQRRWARSVLDIKFRLYPRLIGELPFKTRIMSLLHGLNYLHKSILISVGLTLLCFMLVTGISPSVMSFPFLEHFSILVIPLQMCEFYQKRFYLDWRHELGFHWRVILLSFAKFPYMILGLYDVILGRRTVYEITFKMKNKDLFYRKYIYNAMISCIITSSWLLGIIMKNRVGTEIYILSALLIIIFLALIIMEYIQLLEPFNKLRMTDSVRSYFVSESAEGSSHGFAKKYAGSILSLICSRGSSSETKQPY